MTWLAWGLPLLGGAGVLSTAAVWLGRHRTRRQRYLSQLALQRSDLIRDTTIQIAATDSTVPAAEFAQQHIARIEHFVTPACLQILRDEALACIPQMKRTFIPTHKKGATLSYEQIHKLRPHCLAFYHNADVQQWVSQITGETIFPTPDQDQSSLSILCYHEPGDHIGWHYDHNFYRGRHFTVLVSLVNEAKAEGGRSKDEGKPFTSAFPLPPSPFPLSQGIYQRQLPGGKTQDFDTSPNTLIVFEGAKVRHRATPIAADERRVILSMTYCTDPRISRFKEFVRRVKDTAFFGLRAPVGLITFASASQAIDKPINLDSRPDFRDKRGCEPASVRRGRAYEKLPFLIHPSQAITHNSMSDDVKESPPTNFVHELIEADNASGRFGGKVITRFPPEPNGYLHIGHAKSICLNFGTARKFDGRVNMRFDDTNPTREDQEYVDSILEDVRWVGYDWDALYFASDFFEELYQLAEKLIQKGLAYVDSSPVETIRQERGTLTEAGKNSKYRDRPVAENLELFRRMRAGEFPDGAHVLRAKIDMAHPNMNMRDPLLYRIRHAEHHRTGDVWCIYPLYDFTHGYCDSLEGVTHSICTLEFENHRPLYDWLLEKAEIFHPQQIEFARLNLTYTLMSKRKLLDLVNENLVRGWDDPRMPTICGARRRGYTPAGIRAFCDTIGVTKFNGLTDLSVLENAIREDLNKTAPRFMGVLKPLRVVLTNYPEGQVEYQDAVNNPEDPSQGTRQIPFSKVLYIEQDDFMETPPKQFFRLAPGREVRLRWGYFITCQSFVKDANGNVIELHCTYDPATKGGNAPDGRKVKSTIHWVSAEHALNAEVRLYDKLFTIENPADIPENEDWRSYLNPQSEVIIKKAKLEPALAHKPSGFRCQFERLGYFCVDKDSSSAKPVFNRTVTLKDEWAKIQKKGA